MLSSDQINYYRSILIQPVISEKSMEATEAQHKYHFKVNPKANKIEIGRAVEAIFNVRVESVNTLNVRGKSRRQSARSRMGKTAAWKKAIVMLAAGDRIDVMTGQ
jgi:large subunit ribosomal protein L23